MTNEQREKIKSLRKEGWGYKKIAAELCISENSIKSFCKRNQLTGNAEKATDPKRKDSNLCLSCGILVTQTPGYRARKYCSDRCRINWWNKHQPAPGRMNTHSFTCTACGVQFVAYGKRERKYCSRSCCNRQKAGRP